MCARWGLGGTAAEEEQEGEMGGEGGREVGISQTRAYHSSYYMPGWALAGVSHSPCNNPVSTPLHSQHPRQGGLSKPPTVLSSSWSSHPAPPTCLVPLMCSQAASPPQPPSFTCCLSAKPPLNQELAWASLEVGDQVISAWWFSWPRKGAGHQALVQGLGVLIRKRRH